jgi:hypothetical protein
LRRGLLADWAAAVEHPLSATLVPIAESMIRGETVPVERAMDAMREVARFPLQYNALAIPYFSCCDEGREVDALRQEIERAWESRRE